MIPVTVMVAGEGTVSYRIKGRFGKGRPSRFADSFRPIVAWNMTWKCNLKCAHCYINAMPESMLHGLPTEKMLDIVDQVAEVGSPLLLMSGGEPLARPDFFEIAEYAAGKKLRLALSTNGTLITREAAKKLADLGFVYVGVSIDSHIPEWHDKFRGVEGAFEAAMRGLRYAQEAGIPTGVRTTITRYNVEHVVEVVRLAAERGVPRIALYHLDISGRASELRDWLPTPQQYFWLLDRLIELGRKYAGVLEIETVTASFDGIYIADKIAGSRDEFLQLLEVVKAQGGCGRKIVSIYPDGEVHPCQFVSGVSLGNVAKRRLREILRLDNPALKPFIETHKYLRGPKCSSCPFKEYCQGGSRTRALAFSGDLFADDPYCYLDVHGIARRWGLGG